MATRRFLLFFSIQLFLVLALTGRALSQGGCGDSCNTLNDCDGQLVCRDGQCDDDPDVGTDICSGDGNGDGNGGCGDSCNTLNDCDGQLVCRDGQCDDDPDVGTDICSGDGNGGGNGNDTGTCNATSQNDDSCCDSDTCYKTSCSPPVTSSTPAILTENNFEEGGDGGGPSECDNQFHSNDDMVVALSTGWYDDGSRCGKSIAITANGNTVKATVVDECDSRHGCDGDHDDQPPCANNIVDASDAVWQALGVSKDDPQYGFMDITWTDA